MISDSAVVGGPFARQDDKDADLVQCLSGSAKPCTPDRVVVDGGPVRLADLIAVARGHAAVVLDPRVADVMERSRAWVTEAVAQGKVLYGATTGVGALANTPIRAGDVRQLQLSLLRSHAAAVGEPLADEVVRGLLLLRARTLAAGYSGVRVELPQRLFELLDHDLLPVIPNRGSVGASGDLAQLAHLALPLVGEGRLRRAGAPDLWGSPAGEVLACEGIEPLILEPKEGLALINGTEPMQVMLALAVADAALLVQAADVACALSVEALLGSDQPFDERIHRLRPHPGQLASASNLRALLARADHRVPEGRGGRVQDAYSLRCAPQVHGAVRDVLDHARRVIEIELGSVIDNPLITPEGDVLISGNFHGEPLAFAADMLGIAVAELASISERRVHRMLDPALSNGLPGFLAVDPGMNCGYMLAQYTAASLISENRVLAHPASVDTIPTSGNQEDHVSMGWTAMLKLHQIVANVRAVLAIEMVVAAQGIDLRTRTDSVTPSPAVQAVQERLRADVPTMPVDRYLADQLTTADRLLPELINAAQELCGNLE